jgi:hypothetical protein
MSRALQKLDPCATPTRCKNSTSSTLSKADSGRSATTTTPAGVLLIRWLGDPQSLWLTAAVDGNERGQSHLEQPWSDVPPLAGTPHGRLERCRSALAVWWSARSRAARKSHPTRRKHHDITSEASSGRRVVHPDAPSPGQVIFLFAALTMAAVVLTLVAAYWRHDGAEALGYLGGGMFAAALAYVLLESSRWPGRRPPPR